MYNKNSSKNYSFAIAQFFPTFFANKISFPKSIQPMTGNIQRILRVPGIKVLKPFLQTFGKIALKICTIKTIFFYDKHMLL